MRAEGTNRPTFDQCAQVLRAAGIATPLTKCEFLTLPDYSPNIIGILNDRYVLRASTIDGTVRFARERRALDRLRAVPGIPQVLDAGTLELGEQAHYLLQDKIPGQTVFSHWLGAPDETRVELVTGLVAIIRQVHRLPAQGYVIGHYQSALRDWSGPWLAGHDTYIQQLLAQVRSRPLSNEQSDLVRESETYYAAHRDSLAYSVGPRFAHGDLHLYNVLAHDGRVTGVIDWEWAYGGGTEPDFDLDALFRWAIYPAGIAEEAIEDRVAGRDFAALIPAVLAAYPEIAAVPRLRERMTIYQIEHELHKAAVWPGNVPRQPIQRLHGWLREDRLAAYLA